MLKVVLKFSNRYDELPSLFMFTYKYAHIYKTNIHIMYLYERVLKYTYIQKFLCVLHLRSLISVIHIILLCIIILINSMPKLMMCFSEPIQASKKSSEYGVEF